MHYLVTSVIETTKLNEDGQPADPPVTVRYYTGESLPLALSALMMAATDDESRTKQLGWIMPRTLSVSIIYLTDEEYRAHRAKEEAEDQAAEAASAAQSAPSVRPSIPDRKRDADGWDL